MLRIFALIVVISTAISAAVFTAIPASAADAAAYLDSATINHIREQATEFARLLSQHQGNPNFSAAQALDQMTMARLENLQVNAQAMVRDITATQTAAETKLKSTARNSYAPSGGLTMAGILAGGVGAFVVPIWANIEYNTAKEFAGAVSFLGSFVVYNWIFNALDLHTGFKRLFEGTGKAIHNLTISKTAAKKIWDVFFTRLAELGVPFDRKDPIKWLSAMGVGNPVPTWESMSSKEKRAWANGYRDFLLSLQTIHESTDPALAAELGRLASEVRESIPNPLWPIWINKKYRQLSQKIAATFAKLAKLDEVHHFTKHPVSYEDFHYDQRALFDYESLFEPATRELLLNSRLALPRKITQSLSMLHELGAKFSLTPTNTLTGGGRGQTRWVMNVSIPNSEALTAEFTMDYTVEGDVTDASFLHTFKNSRIYFSAAFNKALENLPFAETIRERYETTFPDRSCKTALSVPEKIVLEATEAAL